jgi:hypothetical protein
MAEMGFGYGSEYQLLRALGHHRDSFFKEIREAIGTELAIEWLDYPKDETRLSLDGEYCDIECFGAEPFYGELLKKWPAFWPVKGPNAQNWDGIFRIGSKWFFVEAKAHITEMKSSHRISPKSEAIIVNSLDGASKWLHAEKDGKYWAHSSYYQMANRLAFCHFLRDNGIEASLVNVFFMNGYERPFVSRTANHVESKSVTERQDWEKAIEAELYDLGLTEEALSGIVYNVIVDCLSL